MPFVRSADAVTHEVHGVRFVSYANTAQGSSELCAWRVEIPAGTIGVPHTVSREEVLYVLSGSLRFSVDGDVAELSAGDTGIVPAGARFAIDNTGAHPASAWVSTGTGLTATLADGSLMAPPWAA
ncbi:cupin domain-containing protein [Streptacidiphilus sp. PB12-B1b]|uniref:cupin domain-containing protein n=1 Tax=Streptacidiphilus sp. PB12-B1b TaxID=2705012 RepID=UPI0015FC6298|nr:cupin domain-containing protein [Streptacidiphilus sp. PB12-B1b]QMU80091.1 cupin domain-containing protein [Streptacidiphilus sp. PB12-B1b]